MVVLDPFIGPAIGLAGSLFGSSGPSAGDRQRAQSAFEAQNAQIVAQLEALDAQKDVDRARYSRALAEWEYSKGEAMKQYYYEVAQLELLKEIDAQRGIDQMDFNRKLIQAAGEGFELQAEQLEQQFITAENIRAEQQALDYDYQQTRLGIETSRQVAQYMAEVDRNTAQMDQVMAATTNRGKSVQNQIILEHSVDTFQYHAGLITAAIQSAAEENTAITVSGGSEAAKRIASDRIKEAYRQMGVVELRARGRRASLEQQNQLMQSETAAQALNLSIQSERYAQAISEQTDLYGNEYNFRESIFKDVTIPSFELSSNDYIRELKGLELETEAILDQATLPLSSGSLSGCARAKPWPEARVSGTRDGVHASSTDAPNGWWQPKLLGLRRCCCQLTGALRQ